MASNKSDQDGRKRAHISERPYIPQYDRSTNEQDRFLDYCVRNAVLVTVFLESGRTFQGMVVSHDRKTLLLGPMRQEKEKRMIQKSYIALVRAEAVLPLFREYAGRGNHRTRLKALKEEKRAAAAPDVITPPAEANTGKLAIKRKPTKPKTQIVSGANIQTKPVSRKPRPDLNPSDTND